MFGLKDSGQAEGSTLCLLVSSDDIQQAVVVLSGVSRNMWLIWKFEKEFIQFSFEEFQATVCKVADVLEDNVEESRTQGADVVVSNSGPGLSCSDHMWHET